jgi:murein DD-endopeptidase MepM/ murein hydrolase activator NlpD
MLRENALGGITVYLVDRDQRFVYYYAHLERYAEQLAEGMDVQQGQLLGYVGTSGNAPPNFPHLHFQALRLDRSRRDWWNGPAVDVRPYFSLTGRERTQ